MIIIDFTVMKKTVAAILFILGIVFPLNSFGAMSSTNYMIYADAVDAGGGLSTGGIYTLQDTAGESPAGFSTTSIYEIRAGYQAMERANLSMDISDSSLNLGVLDAAAVSAASSIVTINTDSETGYNLIIQSVDGAGLAAVSDGEVTIGAEEYGFSVQGNDTLISGDVAVTAGTAIASASEPVINGQLILTFKASKSAFSAAGTYSQSVTLSASANW